MAGTKRPTASRKKTARSPSRSSSPRPRLKKVQSSSAPGAAIAARRLGVSPSTLRRWALSGRIRASVDARGAYHFPGALTRQTKKKRLLGYGKKASKKAGKKAPSLGPSKRPTKKRTAPPKDRSKPGKKTLAAPRKKRRAPAPPPPAPPRAPVRKKRPGKLPGKKFPGKKAAPRRKKKRALVPRPSPPRPPAPAKKRPSRKKLVRRKKKKVVPRFAPIPEVAERERPTLTETIRQTREQIARGEFAPFGVTVQIPSPEAAPERRLTVDEAAQRMGPVMRDYVMARFQWERDMTHDQFWAMKYAFKQTYGVREWRRVFEWIVDEWGLEDYMFDREALRDS